MENSFLDYSLNDAVQFVIDRRGVTPKKLGGDWAKTGYRAISAKNVKTGKIINLESIHFVSPEMYKKWMKTEIQKNDILITSEAPFGEVFLWKYDEKIVVSQRVFCLRIKPEFDPSFIYYYMTTKWFKSELDGRSTGTTVTGLRQPELLKCKIKAPSLATQRKIASVLSAIDDRIELNERMNKNLEEESSAIFNDFYMSLADERIERFSDNPLYGTLIMGQSPKGESYNTNGSGLPLLNGAADYTNMLLTPQKYTTAPTRISKKGDLIFCIRATIGLLVYGDREYCLGRGVASITNTDAAFREYVYHVINNSIETLKANANGSVIVGINRDDILRLEIKRPKESEIARHHDLQKGLFEKIESNRKNSLILAELRDTLLPKLMSGEIDVDSVEI